MAGKALLKFTKNETYNIKIENISDMNKSVFTEVYINAYKILNELLKQSSRSTSTSTSTNNIIAFLGERGSGKTSCMESFGNSLEDVLNYQIFNLETSDLKEQLEEYTKLMENARKMKKINIIEPTFFSKDINILGLVVSNMFKEFNQEICKNSNCDYEKRKKLLKKFHEIFKSMRYMESDEVSRNSEIEELLQLSTAISFKEELKDLIDEYLDFFKGSKLIISIDDIDLNTEFAYEMVEEIRKYLSINNVIILMALKLDQLKTVIIKNYIKENNALVKINEKYSNIIDDIENRAEKYLLKLIPVERRLYLKDFDEYDFEFEILIDDVKIDYETKTFQDIILDYIYKKTGVIFLPARIGINNIIPKNFRELVGFISMLGKLNKITSTDIKIKNYLKFKEYFYNYYIKQKIYKEKDLKIVQELLRADWKNKNKIIKREMTDGSAGGYVEGSIFSTIENIEGISVKDETRFSLKTIYSFFLQETYKKYLNGNKKEYLLLLGKNYSDNDKFSLINIKREILKKKKVSKLLSLFFIEEEAEMQGSEQKVKFSLFAPYYNILIKDELYKKFSDIIEVESEEVELNITFRNMDLLQEFYSFLNDIEIDKTKKIGEIIKDIYGVKLPTFINGIEILEKTKKENIKEELKKFINDSLCEKITEIQEENEKETMEKEELGEGVK
ncbi:MAG: hypothetical protein ACRDDK_00205 [Cetobacterium sp.]